jgi:hypothetical protein
VISPKAVSDQLRGHRGGGTDLSCVRVGDFPLGATATAQCRQLPALLLVGGAFPASYWQKLLLQRSLPVGTLSALIVAQSSGGIEGCGAE